MHNTQAYLKFKQQLDDTINFASVVCYAMPCLRIRISDVANGRAVALPKADFFTHDKATPSQVRQRALGYRGWLATYLWLNIFSFFEAFVIDVSREIVKFQGGRAEFVGRARKRDLKFIAGSTGNLNQARQKLQEWYHPGRQAQYHKYTRSLQQYGYRFPTELLSSYGARMFAEKTKKMWAHEIPGFLTDALLMTVSPQTRRDFRYFQKTRNKLAHGKKATITLRKVLSMGGDLRKLATAINEHVAKNFMIIEKFSV